MGRSDWKFWVGLALVVTIPYLGLYWWLAR